MKKSTIALSILGLIVLGLGGVMAATNPSDEAYDEYATVRLTEYLDENVCAEAGLLKQQCTNLLKSGQAQLKAEIAKRTQKHNWWILTTYETDLSVSFLPFVPSYDVKVLGAFNSFYIYKIQKK